MLSILDWQFDAFPRWVLIFFLDFTNAFISFDTSHRFSQEDFGDMPYLEVKQFI